MKFTCIECRKKYLEIELIQYDVSLICQNCGKVYQKVSSRPILLDNNDIHLINEAIKSLQDSEYRAVARLDISTKDIWKKHLFPHLNIRHIHWKFLMTKVVEMVDKINLKYADSGARILDIGAGDGRYGKLPFSEKIDYCCTDLAFTNTLVGPDFLDFISSAESIPLPNCSMDVVFNFAVLEHVSRPEHSITEIVRILKDDGIAFLIFPMVRPEHMIPFDYQRFTRYWLPELIRDKKLNIEIVEQLPSNGILWTSFWYLYGSLLTWPLQRIRYRILGLILNRALYIILQPFMFLILWLDKHFEKSMPIYYWVEIKKV